MNIIAGVIGGVFLVLGLLMLRYRSRADDLNMKVTPKWMKPADGGGIFAPERKRFRIRNQTIAAAIMTGLGLFLIGAAIFEH